tara:strand:+ start:191 stop:1291 length:1101 start_codon:yes stop_codon:yes gene_type:complete
VSLTNAGEPEKPPDTDIQEEAEIISFDDDITDPPPTSSSITPSHPADTPSLPPKSYFIDEALKPKEIVKRLDDYIVGQADAKKAIAIALRNRWRRKQLPEDLRNEIIPKNILMVGPTGCGKTEIARRIAKLSQAPFIKVEATKFTEVGFHGRDVDSIIRDLVDIAINQTKKKQSEILRKEAKVAVENKILESLVGPHGADEAKEVSHTQRSTTHHTTTQHTTTQHTTTQHNTTNTTTRQSFRRLLRTGELDSQEVEVDVPENNGGKGGDNVVQIDPANPVSVSELIGNFQKMGMGGKKTNKKKMKISDAAPIIEEMELEKLLDMSDVKKVAIAAVEESGIVFIDEIDKICSSGDGYRGGERAESTT